MCSGIVLPGTAKEIVDVLIKKHRFTIKEIAKKARIGQRTIVNIQKGEHVSGHTEFLLIQVYIRQILKRRY